MGDTCFDESCVSGPVDPALLPVEINSSVRIVVSTISWSDIVGPYSVYRGVRLATGYFTYNQTCLVAQTSASSVNDTSVPSVGTAFYYLVARNNPCGPSVLTLDSDGTPAPNYRPCPLSFAAQGSAGDGRASTAVDGEARAAAVPTPARIDR